MEWPLLADSGAKLFFGSPKTNFPGCRRGDRIIAWGTTAISDELAGNFGSALENTSSVIVAWLPFSRKNRCKPFLEFCNTKPTSPTFHNNGSAKWRRRCRRKAKMSALSKVGMSVFPLLVVPNQRPLLEEE